ncbi:WecB/TagA/CpsF family glycosyltransferase [Candidatus Gottesmanbacteria bacterium]|nr:WecB/TagA/CpsF family glycosyltransferase [Candidatus Gottesmanbacteria bacterium]
MGLSTKKIAEIRITTSPKDKILEEIRKYIKKGKSQNAKGKSEEIKPLIIFTPNPEIIVYAQKDKDFVRIVNTAQINLPDGAGVVWALKKLNGISVERISGADFMLDLCNLAKRESFTIGLIGGRGGVALETKECLLKKYPGLKMEVFEAPEVEMQNAKVKIQKYSSKFKSKQESDKDTSGVTEWAPPMVEELEERYFISLINEMKKRKIDILFIALGFPKQEYFIEKIRKTICGKDTSGLIKPLVLMAVGGSFDYISERVKRAPKWIRNIGLEWLYRLVREPWRLSRQLKGAKFFWKVLIS